MHIGIDSFVSTVTDLETGVDATPLERVQHLLEEVERADQVGLDTYASVSTTGRSTWTPPPPFCSRRPRPGPAPSGSTSR